MPEAQTTTQGMEAVQHGSRWLYGMPDENQVKAWFDGNRLHEGMEHEPYYGGIVLIGATEKFKGTFVAQNGSTYVKEQERTVYTPYVKVDTRIQYFWTLVDIMNIRAMDTMDTPDKYIGVIEPCQVRKVLDDKSPFFNGHLPDGFFMYAARGSGGENAPVSRYICAQWSVGIYERQSYLRALGGSKTPPVAVLKGIGTKQTLVAKNYPDDNAIMKAETGAIGRALGVAGILVVGTGIATAEDIQEAQAAGSMPTVNREGEPQLPGVVGDVGAGTPIEGPDVPPQTVAPDVTAELSPQDVDEQRRARAMELSGELKKFPDAWDKYLHWYRDERGFPSLTELTGPALQGALVKLERELDTAQRTATDAPAPPSE